jgi:dTDP-4-dehydrorhamnose reductase
VRTAVLGAPGQLGRDLVPRLSGEVVPLARADLDLTRAESIRAKLDDVRPVVVVNCAAYNFVDKAESELEAAFAANAFGVRHLAHACRDVGAKLVHVSSDYVFGLDATRTTPYAESDTPGPVSVYGASKLAGEHFVLAADPRNLVVRTCGLYGIWGAGGKGGNFVETMLRLAAQGKPVRVVNDQRCTPSSTADVAGAIAAMIVNGVSGLVHATNSGDCTWYEFAAEIFRQSNLSVSLTPITTAEFGSAARRPHYSVLGCTKFNENGIQPLRHWVETLAVYLKTRRDKRAANPC